MLELGGKNPTIVHSSADLKVGRPPHRLRPLHQLGAHLHRARPRARLARGQGRTCRASLSEAIRDFYGDDPKQSPDYGRVINRRNFDRLVKLHRTAARSPPAAAPMPDELYIAPTVLVDVSPDSPIMQEEVFGPILPVLEIDSVEAVIDWVNEPAASARAVRVRRGRRCRRAHPRGDRTQAMPAINDCAIHPLVPELPFGGVGNSGMGKYHGRWGFEAFTNARGVLYHSAQIDAGVRYPPYSEHTLAAQDPEQADALAGVPHGPRPAVARPVRVHDVVPHQLQFAAGDAGHEALTGAEKPVATEQLR